MPWVWVGYIGKRHIMEAIRRLEQNGLNINKRGQKVHILLHRVPFVLEPEYNFKEESFWEVSALAQNEFIDIDEADVFNYEAT
jgi:hypothetical protein